MNPHRPAFIIAAVCAAFLSTLQAQERVLFAFDDNSIPWLYNLKLTLVPAQKYAGNPSAAARSRRGFPDHGHAVLYGTVIKDGGKFRMWYLGMMENGLDKSGQAPGWWRPMCYAESGDGVNWTKPSLGLVDIGGNKRNNACLIEGEPYSLTRVDDYLSVLYEPADPNPARRYKAVFIAHVPYADIRGGMSKIGKKEERVCATICAVSADGLRWKVVGDRPANAGGERFEVSSLYHFGNFYYSTGQLLSPWTWRADGSDIGRSMLVYRSPDFVTWSKAKASAFARPGQLVRPPVAGQQTHMGAGLWNRGNVVVGLYGMWQDGPGPAGQPPGADRLWGTHIDLGLILSNDGIHFREPVPNFKIIGRGREGEWDHVAVLQGNAFVNVGDKTMIWYSHWDTGGSLENMEIGLATLRRDGFGYLSCKQGDEAGFFVTSPVGPNRHRHRLLVNADGLTPEAPLSVELVDASDRPLAGFSGPHAASLAASGTRQEIVWPKAKSPGLPAGHSFAIKVGFPLGGDARLYSLNLD